MANIQMKGDVILRFDEVTFNYGHNKPILNEVSFSVRESVKFTLMGQNGAGKSTLFSLITGDRAPEEGEIHIRKSTTVAIAKQVVEPLEREMTVREYFESAFPGKKVYDIDPKVAEVLDVVHLKAPFTKKIREFSGGQQARLLLAFALIQKPDILLLDEPTNNLDPASRAEILGALKNYSGAVVMVSHDEGAVSALNPERVVLLPDGVEDHWNEDYLDLITLA